MIEYTIIESQRAFNYGRSFSIPSKEVITLSAIKHYDTARHQRWRAAVLRRAGYICQECVRYGRRTPQGLPVPATVAHHIQTVEEHPELRLDPSNGEALCAACHNARHPEKGGRKW